MEPTVGRRDRKKAATRDALHWAALRLAQELGYENVTVEAITAAADVSVRTFFNYFATKDDALLGTDDRRPEGALPALLAARPAEEPIADALRAALTEVATSLEDADPAWRARFDLLQANPQLLPKVFAYFTEFERSLAEVVAVRTGRDVDTDISPGVTAAAVIGVLRVAMTRWRSAPGATPLATLLDQAFAVLADGLEGTKSSTTIGETQ